MIAANAAPIVTAPANQNANEGGSTLFSLGSFTDAATDTPWAVSDDWGRRIHRYDLQRNDCRFAGHGESHVRGRPSDPHVTVTVTDKDGASGQTSFSAASPTSSRR